MSGIAKSWEMFATHVRPRRLFHEDPGVKGPLWFGRRPDSPWHIFANLLRLFFAIVFAPVYLSIPHSLRSMTDILTKRLWSFDWAETPDALLIESPGTLASKEGETYRPLTGRYAVTGSKPTWLLEVKFKGTKIVSQEQLQYGEERSRERSRSENASNSLGETASQRYGPNPAYTAISYSMESAKALFDEAGSQLDPQPDEETRRYGLQNKRKISQALLNEYARARRSVDAEQDDIELIWLDEFCLSDPSVTNEEECNKQRNKELGKLADIFRRADQVVVFCHAVDCDHTGSDCLWGTRLFTMGEILHARIVHVMTRNSRLESQITVFAGQDFRTDMQTCAAEARQWHLYNIMQHATNSGGVPWQSAIHSLVVEAIRRDEAGNFHDHKFLGKALNGLLPRRSQLEDLRGVNGWTDLAWLLELNQGYYNTTLLVAVCKLADPYVQEYRWWGKPIVPKEGSERLEALVTSFPVKICRSDDHHLEPALSIICPKSITLAHWLQRDSAGLYKNDEMRGLKLCMIWGSFIIIIIAIICSPTNHRATAILIYLSAIIYSILELLVGTIYVEKATWIAVEDHNTPGHDPVRWIQSQDPSCVNASEWGDRQLAPRWDDVKSTSLTPRPYNVTLMDLRSGVFTKAVVTSCPNDMVILAVHGSGITSMLLSRDAAVAESTITSKVGMANLPPFALAQADQSGTVYVGGGSTLPVLKSVPLKINNSGWCLDFLAS